jgi:arylsulfatase A
MNARAGFRLALVVSAAMVSSFACSPQGEQEAPQRNGPPNIVILFADDLGYGDLGSYGNPSIDTPVIDKLASEGLRWTDFYAMASLCSPSRGSLLTGRVPVRSGLYGRRRSVLFPGNQGGMPDEELTLAEGLKSAGYDSIAIGKWHLGDRPEYYPTRHGFDEWLGLPYSNDLAWAGPGGDSDRAAVSRESRSSNPDWRKWNVALIHSKRDGSEFVDTIVEQPVDQTMLTQRYTEAAVEFIERHADGETPFLLYLPYTMPHVPLFASESFLGTSRRGLYGDTVEEIDWSVGQIRETLERLGLAENTLLVFTSDNGPWTPIMGRNAGSTGPLSGGKASTWEGGFRVPAVFWWPGVIEPRTVHDIGTAMDLYTTAFALAGVPLPDDRVVDGVDLSPVIGNTGHSPRNSLPYYASGELRAYREGRYKIHFVTQGPGNTRPRVVHETPLLFDLGVDPAEEFDLAAEMPDVLDRVVRAARAHQASFEMAESIFDRGVPGND